jgi:dUTP pyrophosphatase
VILVNHDPVDDYTVNRGDRIAQLVIVAVEEAAFDLVPADGLGEAARGAGGFGHTGT